MVYYLILNKTTKFGERFGRTRSFQSILSSEERCDDIYPLNVAIAWKQEPRIFRRVEVKVYQSTSTVMS